jgi:hypothetical protein
VPTAALKLQGRIIQHNTKSQTKNGIDVLKVTIALENEVGGDSVRTPCTFAVRVDKLEDYPIDHAVEITIGHVTK